MRTLVDLVLLGLVLAYLTNELKPPTFYKVGVRISLMK
jgi:hypothetical protein